MIEVGVFMVGCLFGAALVKYGIDLWSKCISQVREEEPLFGLPSEPVMQEFTGEEEPPVMQEETEVL